MVEEYYGRFFLDRFFFAAGLRGVFFLMAVVLGLSNPLRVIAHELLNSLKSNASVDWQHRESARARMRIYGVVVVTIEPDLPSGGDVNSTHFMHWIVFSLDMPPHHSGTHGWQYPPHGRRLLRH